MEEQKGQALVELSIVISIFLLLIMGVVEFALIGHAYVVIHHASREGARAAALHSLDGTIEQVVENASASLDGNRVSVLISPEQSLRYRGTPVAVTVLYDLIPITPLGGLLPNPLLIRGESIMRME